jgi:hypothetical protein
MLGFELGSNVPYARILEFDSRRIKARPYIKPSILSVQKRIPRFFAEAMRRNLGG